MKEIDRAGKCGLFCGACPFYLGTKDPAFKEKWIQERGEWEEGWYCLGCSNLDEKSWGNDCSMVLCAKEHHADFCYQCKEYPCDKLEKFSKDDYPHHHTCIRGLERMKQIGCDAWIKEQEKRWNCPSCGAHFDWYSKHCHQCGTAVYNCVDEDKESKTD